MTLAILARCDTARGVYSRVVNAVGVALEQHPAREEQEERAQGATDVRHATVGRKQRRHAELAAQPSQL